MRDKTFNIAKNPKYDGYQWGFICVTYNFFNKKSSRGAVTCARTETLATRDISLIKMEIMSNQKLAEEFHKLIIRKFEKREV